MGKLIVVSGPSCVGKGPLHRALKLFFPDLTEGLRQTVLFNSRAPRPGEIDGQDYHFRPAAEIETLRDDPRYRVMVVRGDVQAVDLDALQRALSEGDVFFEGNPFVGRALLEIPDTEILGIFLTPLSGDELRYLLAPERKVDLPAFVTDVMRRKLLRRTLRQKRILSLPDLENIETRAESAYGELQEAWRFPHIVPNHDGEDSENWDAFYYPVADARRTLLTVAGLLCGEHPDGVEQWSEGMLR